MSGTSDSDDGISIVSVGAIVFRLSVLITVLTLLLVVSVPTVFRLLLAVRLLLRWFVRLMRLCSFRCSLLWDQKF